MLRIYHSLYSIPDTKLRCIDHRIVPHTVSILSTGAYEVCIALALRQVHCFIPFSFFFPFVVCKIKASRQSVTAFLDVIISHSYDKRKKEKKKNRNPCAGYLLPLWFVKSIHLPSSSSLQSLVFFLHVQYGFHQHTYLFAVVQGKENCATYEQVYTEVKKYQLFSYRDQFDSVQCSTLTKLLYL